MSVTLNKKYEVLFFPRIEKTIAAKFEETASIVKSNGINAAISALNNELTNPELTKEIQRLYATVGVRTANNTYRQLRVRQRGLRKPVKEIGFDSLETKAGGSFGFNDTWVRWILNYLQNHLVENLTFDVNATTRNHILKVLSQSISEGLGIDKTVELLKNDTFSETQSARIARTEVNIASNAGTLAAGETYEYQMQKEWVAVNDPRTRGTSLEDDASHRDLNGTVIDFEDVFIDPRNGDRLKSPGDPRASAGSIINCRCQLTLKPKEDERGRLIPKRRSTVVIYPNQNRTQRTVLI
jgi:hypothetical protein